MSLFSFRPNWGSTFTDRREWLNDEIVSRSGISQRIRLRTEPRRTWTFSFTAHNRDAAYLSSFLTRYQSSVIAVPFWPDKVVYTDPIGSNTTSIPNPFAGTDFDILLSEFMHADGVLIGKYGYEAEYVPLTSVSQDELVLAFGTNNAWDAGAFLVPCRDCRLQDTQGLSSPTSTISTGRFTFLLESTTESRYSASETYRDYPIHTYRPNRSDDLTAEYRRLVDALDFSVGVREYYDYSGNSFAVRGFSYVLRDRAAIRDFQQQLSFLYFNGDPFWVPSWERTLEMRSDIVSGSNSINVQACGLELLNGFVGHGDIAILLQDGSWNFAQIDTISQSGSNNVITLLDNLSFDATAANVKLACFAEPCIFNSDAVEIAYVTPTVATCALSTRSVEIPS